MEENHKEQTEMDQNDKKRIYITGGILALILILALLLVATSGKRAGEKDAPSAGRTAAASPEASVKPDTGKGQETGADKERGAERAATKAGVPEEETAVEVATEPEIAKPEEVIPLEGYVIYPVETARLKESYENVAFDTEEALQELLGYWVDKNLDAVKDLIALPRFEAMSAELSDSRDFYYYGERNASGRPHGKGIAVYADNQYYYGDFAEGVRQGKGEWLQCYPAYSRDVMIEHYYTGEWAKDLPNGRGQDHYEYNENKMNEEQLFLLNAIGTFKDGVYDGEMYLMFENKDGSYTEWKGTCTEGVFAAFGEADDHTRIPILQDYNNESHYIWVRPDRNSDFKVRHIIVP